MPSCPQFNLQFMVGSKPCSCCWQKTFCSYLKNCSAFPFCHSAGWKPLGEDSFIRGWKGSRTPHLQGFWSFCKAPPTGEGHGESSLRIPRSIIPKFLSGMCNEELDPTALTLRLLKWVRALRFNFLAFQCSSKLLRYLWANPPPPHPKNLMVWGWNHAECVQWGIPALNSITLYQCNALDFFSMRLI